MAGITFESFLLVFCRTTGLFLSAPVFNSRQLPAQAKIMLAGLLSFVVAMATRVESALPLENAGYYIMAMIGEVLIGYAMGFVVYLLFAAIQLSGQLIDTQMGFGIVNVMDPQSGLQIPLVGNFQYLLTLLLFLGVNGHHRLIEALHDSYRLIPVMGAHFDGQFLEFVMNLAGYMFVLAVKLAAPIVVSLFLADVALGFMARTVPQMNVFIVGLPFKIAGGLLLLIISIPVVLWIVQILMGRFFESLDTLILVLGK